MNDKIRLLLQVQSKINNDDSGIKKVQGGKSCHIYLGEYMRIAGITIVMATMIEIFGEAAGWQNQQVMCRYLHRRSKRRRVKVDTYLNWKLEKL